MKNENKINELTVNSADLADLWNLDVRTVQRYAKQGIIPYLTGGREYTFNLKEANLRYMTYKTTEKHLDPESLETRKLKAEVEQKEAKAEMAQMQLKELDGQLLDAQLVEDCFSDLLIATAGILRGMPARLALKLSKTDNPNKCAQLMDSEISEVLLQMKNYDFDPDVYKKRAMEKAKLFSGNEETQ